MSLKSSPPAATTKLELASHFTKSPALRSPTAHAKALTAEGAADLTQKLAT